MRVFDCSYLICVGIILLASCSDSIKIKHELRKFERKAIVFPEKMKVFEEAGVQFLPIPKGQKYIIYVSPEECSSCMIHRVGEYAPILALGDSLGFSTMIILSPLDSSLEQVEWILGNRPFSFPIWLDFDHAFRERNKHIPKDRKFHYFLLDTEGMPIFVGDILEPAMAKLLLCVYEKHGSSYY